MRNYEHGGDIFADEKKMIDFSVNINPLGMPASAREAALYAAAHETSYPDPFCRKLTAALSQRYGLPAENIICGNGASDLILRLCAAILPYGALVPAPGFSEYARSVSLFGSDVFEYALRDGPSLQKDTESPGLDPLLESIEDLAPELVFVCRPNNPDGSIIGLDELREAAELCKNCGAVLAVDECFLEFTEATSALALLDRCSNVVVINAFTKTYAMAGLRLGFMFASDTELLDRIYNYGTPWSVSAPAQAAGTSCCAETAFLAESRRYIAAERKRLVSAFENYGFKVFPSEANFLLIRDTTGLGEAGNAAGNAAGFVPRLTLREKLACRGIKVRDCRSFTGLDDSYIRVGVRTTDENSALISALEDIYG